MVYNRNGRYEGDCLQVMDIIPNQSVDIILADLPFGTTRARWDSIIDLPSLWKQYDRIIKPNGVILLFGQPPFDKVLGASNIKNLKYEWIWEKTHPTGHLNAKKMPMKAHESVLVFYKKLPTYNPQKTYGHPRKVSSAKSKMTGKESELYNKHTKFTDYNSTERYPRSVLKFPSDKQKEAIHSTQKPIDLLEYLIKTYSNEGDLILDNVSGSGSTGIAAYNLKRDCILIEKDPIIFSQMQERLTKYQCFDISSHSK